MKKTYFNENIKELLREDATFIINYAIKENLPNSAVEKALAGFEMPQGKLILVAIGKAAWSMAKTAYDCIGDSINDGIVITKYNHSKGNIGKLHICEAGHPISDQNSFSATEKAIGLVSDLNQNDTVLFLVSGGGSALFEKPLIDKDEIESINKQLLSCGADIVEINTIRKRLSAVKGGRFAKICSPAKVFSVVLSDIIGDRLDMIASGAAYPDNSTCSEALRIAEKYNLKLSEKAKECLLIETPKTLRNIETVISGSVKKLCVSAKEACEKLGYKTEILTDSLSSAARDTGSFLGNIAKYKSVTKESLAFIAGGETVVRLTGKGKGGRNQEIALSAADEICGLENVAVFSVGSDGTDGPTDAAGGFCDGNTKSVLEKQGIVISDILDNNDSYNALKQCYGLIITGATGTNVNDVAVILIKR